MRLHCREHGYMDEKTGPMSECPYCRIDELEKCNASLQQQADSGVQAKLKLKIAQEYLLKYRQEIIDMRGEANG